MSKFKKLFPIFVCFTIAIVGFFMLTSRAFFHFSGNQIFLCLGLIIIGVIGGITMIFITATKNYKNLTKTDVKNNTSPSPNEKKEFVIQDSLKNLFSSTLQNENKPKKIICPYCKCKYDSSKERCPNCGAPPNF